MFQIRDIREDLPVMTGRESLTGIGGWLILVGLGLCVTPIRIAIESWQIYTPVLTGDTWAALTTPSSDYYHPFWAPLLVMEMLVQLVLLLGSVALLVLFFRESPLFPRSFIIFFASSTILIPLDSLAASVVLPNEPVFDDKTVREFSRSLVGSLIWIPYMLTSKRVKNTFRSHAS